MVNENKNCNSNFGLQMRNNDLKDKQRKWVCPFIDYGFRHSIFKVAVTRR